MKLQIKSQKEEELLSRNKVEAELEFEDSAVPSRKDIITKIAEMIKSEPDLVVVTKVDTHFGSHKAIVHAYAYKNKQERDRIEDKKMLVKRGFNIPKIEKKVVVAQ